MPTYQLGKDFKVPFSIPDTHASVSHNHASITVEGDNWILQDNNSTNGTYIEENGVFRRYDKVRITPDTWIRLGEQGHRGYYFKARRVLRPNDYREDFNQLYEVYQEYESTRNKLESRRRAVRYLTLPLTLIGLFISLLPRIKESEWGPRMSIAMAGLLSPFIQDGLLLRLEKKAKSLQKELICPKCRRTLSKDDIINKNHSYCHAH